MTGLLDDLRLASRSLRQRPWLTAVAVLTLGLGLGVSTTIYAVFRPVLYEMPPVSDPDHLSLLFKVNPILGIERGRPTHTEVIEWRQASRAFERVVAISEGEATLAASGDARRVSTHRVSVEYFETIGVKPALGRTFLPDEHDPIEKPVAVISHGLWRALFQQDPAIAGRAVEIGDEPYTIVGVMPEGFWFYLQGIDVWLPLSGEPGAAATQAHVLATARRRADASWEQAQAEIDTLTARVTPRDVAAGWRTLVEPMPREATKRTRVVAPAVFLPALAVLLIACVNVANLLLASGAGRAHEMAVRAAMGAARPRMVRQLFVESAWLAAGGWLAGIFLTYWGVAGLRALIAQSQPEFAARIVITPSVFAVALLLAAVTPLVFGFVPALRASVPDVGELLKGGSAGERVIRGYRFRDLLVPLQLGLAVVLLVTVGMFLRFFWEMEHLPTGLDDRDLYVLRLVAGRSGDAARPVEGARDPGVLLGQVQALPGVVAATASAGLPSPGVGRGTYTVRLDEPGAAPSAGPRVASAIATAPGFFAALRIALPRGRDFSSEDGPGGVPVAIVSAHLARAWWPEQDPIGRTFTLEGRDAPKTPLTVVGVTGDVMSSARLQSPYIYLPLRQKPADDVLITIRLAERGRPDLPALKRAVAGVSAWRLDEVWSFRDRLSQRLQGSGFTIGLFGGFAGLALLLAAIGVYTVVSQTVARRLREIGVRRALGAAGVDVLRAVFGPMLTLCAVGIVLGAGGTLAVTRYAFSLLLDVSATSPVMWVVIVAALAAAGLAALIAPTRRVLRVDPAVVLRQN